MNTAVIIGGGIGGLFTGAFLAKKGFKVTVLEKNETPGGGLQCFTRRGKIFETGMHVMGGFEKGGTLERICRYLGIMERLKIHHINSECIDEIIYQQTGEHFLIPSGKENFIKKMTEYFPHEAKGVREYVEKIYELSREVPLFYLQPAQEGINVHSDMFMWPADKLIAHFVSDSRLQEILAYLNPLYGGVEGHTPAYIHALINVHYINGTSRFEGGSQQLVDALTDIIHAAGGSVVTSAEVTRVDVMDRKVQWVETADGARFSAEWYVSAVHPTVLIDCLPPGCFPKAFTNRMKTIPTTVSAFTLFIDLKPDTFRYIDHTCYYIDHYGAIWTNRQTSASDWPKGFMFMTPPDTNPGEYATRLLIHAVMDYEQVKEWEHTKIGRRGKEYEIWKNDKVEKILLKAEKAMPGLRNCIAHVYAASPLTIRDYFKVYCSRPTRG